MSVQPNAILFILNPFGIFNSITKFHYYLPNYSYKSKSPKKNKTAEKITVF